MSIAADKTVFSLLKKTVNEKAYGSIELNKALESLPDKTENPYITALFYGVLQKSLQLDYILDKLCNKPPQSSIKLILKMGLYKLRYMDVPDYAAVNGAVELCKSLGKGGASGFVNAVLKKSGSVELPQISDEHTLSVNASVPEFLVNLLSADYGFEFAKDLLTAKIDTRTHIRRNGLKIPQREFDEKYAFLAQNSTECGYYVTHNDMQKLEKGDYIIQSLSSMLVAEKFFRENDKTVLDLCAAPGGKAVYTYELHGGNVAITACDIHSHRVELIKKYAAKTGADITAMVSDATVFNSEFESKFDCVICDVPCSGIGVICKKPEILLKITPEDLDEIEKTQRAILRAAARYVKTGGRLCYSTCTVLKRENDGVIENFLKEHSEFAIDGEPMRLFPHLGGHDGFYAVTMKKEN